MHTSTAAKTKFPPEKLRISLADGKRSTVYVSKYVLSEIRPRVVVFDGPTKLADWCRDTGTSGVTGGYFLRENSEFVGEVWTNGELRPYVPIPGIWGITRGSLFIDPAGKIKLAPRFCLPKKPDGDLMQAGPLLVRDGKSIVSSSEDSEGFSATPQLHDPNSVPTQGRFPRVAIGTDKKYLWAVACDGRNASEAGLTTAELAEIFVMLGAREALNLDGGSSSSLVHKGVLLNKPRSEVKEFAGGRPLYSAIIFE